MMASTKMVAVVYAFVALAVCPVIFSAPTPRTCAPLICTQREPSVIKYESGKSYIYNFDTEVVTQLVGSTDETNKIKVKGQAAVAAQSTCELVLTVQNIALTSSGGQAINRAKDIEGSSIRFGYRDGVIDNVCVSDDDPSWSANIKRAIVSMLGNRAINGDTETIETDINGKCKTTYEVSGTRYKKTKDLLSCTNRDGGSANAFGVPYGVPAKYNSIPVFQSVLECTQDLGKGVIQNVECNEGHAMAVIENSGVRTDIKSTLSLSEVQSTIVRGREPNKKSCLLYDYGDVEDGQRQKASASNAVDLLNKLCTEIESGTVSLKVPGLFLQLRKQVKHAKKDDLKLMHEQITTGKICSRATSQLGKIYLDAVAISAGDGPISFLAEVVAEGKAQDSTKDQFIVSIVFAEHPGAQALEGVLPLVAKANVEPDYLLAVTGLAHQYCKMSNPQCGSNDKYIALVDAVVQHVRSASDEETVEKVIVALQALGNLDSLTPAAVTAVSNLLDDSHTCQRLKTRALDASRRDPCQETLKKKAAKIFSDVQESSNVRIQAYLTLSRCLTPEDVPVIQAVVDHEDIAESNQVGSFVVSHVSNLLESASPGKQHQKKVFELIKLREFPNDIRKFSRNFELSMFDSSLINSGLSLDSNLIFSQDSYIPRCGNANFTVDAVGRSYNLMEFGLCVQDFEDIIERIAGPTSRLRTTTLDDIIREGADKLGKLKASISSRFRRDVAVTVNQNEIDAIRNEVDIHERTGDNAAGDLYVRVLGTSVIAESFSRNGLKHNPLGTRILRAVEKLTEGAREQNVDITEPFIFLDDEIQLPTSCGLPLTVTVEGNSVLSLQIDGNLDVVSLMRGNNGDMRAKVMPSAATVVRARMVFGTAVIQSGLQVEGKIHSSAAMEFKVVRDGGKLELRANVPQERIQLIDIRSDVYWVEQTMDQLEKKTPIKPKVASRSLIDNSCTTDVGKILGLKLCADVKVPQSSSAAPFFFLNGPSVASLSIEKIEPSMEGYYLKVEKTHEQDTYGLDFVLDTPGSRTNRKITAQGRAIAPNSATPQYSLKLETPANNLEVLYKRSLTDELKGVELQVTVDGDAYTGLAEVRKTPQGAGYKLNPLVQYQLPQGNPVKLLEGEITRIPGQQLSVDVKTGGPFRVARGSIKGNVVVKKSDADNCEIEYNDLEFASEVAGKVLLSGVYKRTGKLYDLKVDSKYGQDAQHTLTVDAEVGSPAPRHNVLKVVTRSSRREFLNFDLDWSLKRGDNKIDHELKYTRGVSEPKVVVKQSSEIEIKSWKEFDIENELTIKHPAYNIDFHAEAEAKSVPGQERHAKLELKAAEDLKAEVSYQTSGDGLVNYKILGHLVAGEKTYEVSETSTKVDADKRHYKTRLSVEPGFFYEANTDVSYKYLNGELNSDLVCEITSDQFAQPLTLKSTVTAKKDGYAALLKFNARGKTYVDLETSHQISSSSPPSYATKMKAVLYDCFEGKLSNTWSNGNGDLAFDALFLQSDRKIVGTSKLARSGDVYDLKADLKWDANKDPSKALTLISHTQLSFSEIKLESKNEITVVDKTAKINLKGSLARDLLNGENSAEIEYVSPSGKTYSVGSKLDLENKQKLRAGKLTLRIAPADVQPSELEVGLRASNLDAQERTFDLKADIKANYRQEKDLTIHGELSSTLPGNYRSYAARLNAEGSAIPKPLALSLKTDVKSGRVAIQGESTSPFKSNVDATIDFDYWSPKKTFGVKYSITTPVDRIKTLEGELQGSYLYNSYKNFEVSNQISVTLNGGSPYSSAYHLSVLDREAKYSHKFISEGKPVVIISAEGKYEKQHMRWNVNSNVRGAISKLNLDVEHNLPDISVTIGGESTLLDAEHNNFELKVSNKKSADGVYETEFTARANDDEKLKVNNKLEYTPLKKALDLQVLHGDDPIRKLFLQFLKEESGRYKVEGLAKWGEGGQYIHTKGSIHKLDNAIDGELTLDSPVLKANKFSVRVAKSLANGEHGVDITVDGNNKRQIAIALTYASRSTSSYERSFEGTVKVEGQAVGRPIDFNGKFRFDDTTLDRQRDNGEEGRRLRANFEVTNEGKPAKLSLLAKRSNKENRLQASLCKDGANDCQVGNIQFKHEHSDNGNLDYELRITAEQTGDNPETNGIVFHSKFDRAEKHFEHTAKLIISQEKAEQIGYRIYCTPGGKEVGGEILLPTRIIALVATGDKTSSGAYNSEIAFYIDKTKKPNRKISLLFNIGEKTETSDHASGRRIELVLKHPEISKDLSIRTRYAIGGDSIFLDLETVFDVLQAGNELTVSYKLTKEAVSEGRVYHGDISAVSNGLHINIGAKSEVRYVSGELSYKNDLSYENRERQVKTAKVELGISKKRFIFEIVGPSEKLVSFISAYSAIPTGHEIRYEIHLPGMVDTRIVRAIANTVSPRSVQLKTSVSSEPNTQYVEAFLGFRGDDELAAGVYDHLADGRHVVADVSLSLNGTRILSVKSDWHKDQAHAILTRSQQRSEGNLQRLRDMLSNAIDELIKEVRHVSSNIRNAAPDLSTVVDAARTQLQELKQELEQNADTNAILQRIIAANNSLKYLARVVVELARTVRRIAVGYLGGLREALKELPQRYSQILERLPEYLERLKALADKGVEVLMSGSRVAAKVLLEGAERLYEALPPLANVWNWVVDHTEGLFKSGSELIQTLAEKLATVYQGLRTVIDKIATNKRVQALISEVTNKLQALLEEVIQDTKEQLEAFKDYVLSAVPQKEFAAFINALADYIQKKASKTTVDDAAALRDIYDKLKATIKTALADVFTIDLSKGIFRARIPLPVSLKSLTEFTKLFVFPSAPKISLRIPAYTYGLKELINQIRSGAAINELFPPFKGYALLVGSTHYKTFDGRHFEFEGNCQYLLASDFDDSNFTVIVDYEHVQGVTRKSILVTDGDDVVALKPDHTVAINGQPVDLDHAKEAGTLLVEHIGDFVLVRSSKGAVVGCSVREDVCAVKVDGFYHGKVLGLLGTMNLEKFDDFRKPNGEISSTVSEFAESWKLDKTCREPIIVRLAIQSTQSAAEKCSAALDSRRSSLRPCYGVVDPTPYRNVCEKLSNVSGYTEQKAVCTASIGYAKACHLSYATVDAVPACEA